MNYDKPIVLSIAGFDPTGGAGVLSDVKTFENNGVLGMAVTTAITGQTENKVHSVNWISEKEIFNQLNPILESYKVDGVKIGVIEDFTLLLKLVESIKNKNKDCVIVWDPIKVATSGEIFLNDTDTEKFVLALDNIDCITPNIPEYDWLCELISKNDLLKNKCIYLKGGHRKSNLGIDSVIENGKNTELLPSVSEYHDKHGTGCILSSALVSHFVRTKNWLEAGKSAKAYLEKVTSSNVNRLAYHVE